MGDEKSRRPLRPAIRVALIVSVSSSCSRAPFSWLRPGSHLKSSVQAESLTRGVRDIPWNRRIRDRNLASHPGLQNGLGSAMSDVKVVSVPRMPPNLFGEISGVDPLDRLFQHPASDRDAKTFVPRRGP